LLEDDDDEMNAGEHDYDNFNVDEFVDKSRQRFGKKRTLWQRRGEYERSG
jgi:hypothetical protein